MFLRKQGTGGQDSEQGIESRNPLEALTEFRHYGLT